MFPKSKEQGAKFKAQVVKMIHDPKMRDQYLEAIKTSPDVMTGVAQVSAMVLAKVVSSIGDEVNPDFLSRFIKALIEEFFEMMEAAGILNEVPPPELMAQVAQMAGQMADEMMSPETPQQQQVPQQQGALGGI